MAPVSPSPPTSFFRAKHASIAEITVLVRRDTKFSKVFQAAEKKFGKEPGACTFKFTYEGRRIQKEETPAEVNMEDGDTIDAHLGQVGGGHPW
ncbi:small ubiquitin-like modifier [Armillaria fumosa]|nr:small ubiquitin-like modifier [Armillaria fumosa]